MRHSTLLIAVAIVAAACGSAEPEAVTSVAPTTQPPQTTAAPATTSPPTTAMPNTTAAETTTTTEAPAAGEFAIVAVVFGENGGAAIQNTGDTAASTAGHWICQRPGYSAVPDVTLDPGEIVWLTTGDPDQISFDPGDAEVLRASVGQFRVGNGDLAFYVGNSFGDASSIRSYVNWGSPGGGRASVAVRAGIWPDGGSVEVTDTTTSISTPEPPTTEPSAWVANA